MIVLCHFYKVGQRQVKDDASCLNSENFTHDLFLLLLIPNHNCYDDCPSSFLLVLFHKMAI